MLEEIQFEARNTEAEAAASYAIADIEVSGTEAEVLLHAKEDCTAVVAIYEEGSEKPYAFGSAVVDAGENRAVVEIEASSLPQYFEAKGYLVDTDTMRPLCREYNSLMYTRAMQEFLAKTADDFGDATVINLDDDKKTNFLVLNDSVLLIKEEPGQNEGDRPVNRLIAYDEKTATYTFENVDDSVKGLKQGDIFLYQYGESELDVYIIKVEKIELQETDGVTVAIIVASKDELGAEEIFQHVRIDQVSGTAEMREITQEDCPDGVTYLGRESGAAGYEIGDTGTVSLTKDTWELKWPESDGSPDGGDDSGIISGSIEADIVAGFGATFTLEYYLDWQLFYMDIKCEIEASVEGEITASVEAAIPLITTPVVPEKESELFTISYTPKLAVSGEIEGTVKIGMGGFLGVKAGAGKLKDSKLEAGESYGPYNGLTLNILQLDAEATVQVGIKFDPQLKVGTVFNAELETGALLGISAEASNDGSVSSESSWKKHDCGVKCLAITGYFNIPLDGELKAFKWKEYDLSEIIDAEAEGGLLKIEFAECYYSIAKSEFGWGTCPEIKYLTSGQVHDKNGKAAVSGATVTTGQPTAYALENSEAADVRAGDEQAVSDSKGVVSMWLPAGEHTLNVSKNGETTQNKVVVDGAKKLKLLYDYVEEKVYTTDSGNGVAGIRRKDGSLWMWGDNQFGAAGVGTNNIPVEKPVKVLTDVREVDLSYGISLAIREDGSLWTWGYWPGHHESTGRYTKPDKLMENVKAVDSSGDTRAALKEDGSLWTWGSNWRGAAGTGTAENTLTPVKIMDQVKEVKLGRDRTGAALKEDGSLWMWGSNEYGQVGNGTEEDQLTPVKVLEHVVDVKLCNDAEAYTAAVTEDGSLYMWGSNYSGRIGNGEGGFGSEGPNQLTPFKVMDNVRDTDVFLSNVVSAAITKDNSLWMWGSAHYGFGTGEIEDQLQDRPVKVMDDVRQVCIEGSGTYSVIKEDGSLWVWGDNNNGWLGIGATEPVYVKKAVKLMDNVRESIKFGGGEDRGVIKEDGSLWIWGRNSYGCVGNGTTDIQTTPYKALDGVRECTAVGYNATMFAQKEDGSLWTWGSNFDYLTGNPSNDASGKVLTVPTQVSFSEEARTVSEPANEISADSADSDEGIVLAAQTVEPGSPAQFSGLLENEIYNFYAVKERNTENALLPDNLLYIGQYMADENGSLSVLYMMREDYDTPEVFVVGLVRKDIAAAQITVPDFTYDGNRHLVEAEVACDGKTLKEGTDYEIYGDCLVTEPGEYHVEIRGAGEYGGSVDVTFHVKKEGENDPGDDPGNDPGDDPGNVPGEPGDDLDPDRNDVLPEDVPADGKIPDGIWIAGLDESSYPYTGSAIKPAVRVYDGKTRLVEKTDYTISYKNHTKANDASVAKTAPTVTVTGKGNYSGKDTAVYKILPLDINGEAFGADDLTLLYNKKPQKPIPALWWDSKKLKNRTDYTVTYYNKAGDSLDACKETGDYEIELTGTGNFTGKRRIALHVTADLKLMSKMSVAKIPNQTYLDYKGGPVTPAVTVKDGKTVLTEGTHYTVSYSNHTKIGTGYVVVKGLEAGGYSGTKRVSFKITGVSISRATVSGLAGQTFVYGGTDIVPALTLSLKSGSETQTLTEECYSVSWQKNRNAGTATVIFNGNQKNGYIGTVKKTFIIQAFNIAGNAEGRFQAELEEKAAPYAKGGSRPKLKVTFKKADGTVEILQEGKDYTLACTNNKAVNDGSNAGKLPTATVKGKGNFTGTFAQKLNYTITTQDIGKLSMTASDKTYQNKKNIFSTKVVVTDLDGKALRAGTDYEKQFTYTYKEAVKLDDGTVREAGDAVDKNDIIPAGALLEVGVTGKGNYTGTCKSTYRISKAAISAAKVTIPVQTYTGRSVTPGKDVIVVKVKGKPVDPSQYEIVSYQNNIKKGNASVTIRGVDNYGGTKTVKFKIRAKGFLWWWR